MKIVLGSSSLSRRKLLKKLPIDFECSSPDIDETRLADESPEEMVQRLSIAKSKEVAKQYPEALIIGSDQVAVFDNQILGKPGAHEKAVEQLTLFTGETVHFITGLCLYNSNTGHYQYYQADTRVKFRQLSQSDINNYLLKDKPYQCAGSFRSEELGVALFESIESNDPTALIGLPIMKLVEMLNNEGVNVLDNGL